MRAAAVWAMVLTAFAWGHLQAQPQPTFPAGQYEGPVPATGIKAAYQNNRAMFFLAGPVGSGSYISSQDEKARWTKLVFQKAASLKLENYTDQGVIYKDEKDPFYLFFSILPQNTEYGQVYPLYFSLDGNNFTRWLTPTGTKKIDVTDTSVSQLQQAFQGRNSNGGQGSQPVGGPTPTTSNRTPDGKKPHFPITGKATVEGGEADVTVLPEGVIQIHLDGRHSGMTGSTRYSCEVILSGYKDGQPYTILNKPHTETLTVGADFLAGTAHKTADFTQTDAFSQADRDNIRNIRVLFDKNKSGDNFADVVKGLLGSAGDFVDEADALYKKIKQSEIGQDATAAAVGGR